jgi:hypothetical protein
MNFKTKLLILAGLFLALAFFHPITMLGLPVIGMALGKDRSRINVRGGGTLLMRELKPTATDGFSDMGVVESIVLSDESGMIDIPDAEGNALEYLQGSRRVGIEITLAQTSKDEVDFVTNCGGKYYDVFYAVPMEDLTTQSISFCLVKFKPGNQLTFAGSTKRTCKLTGVALAPKAAFTRTPTAFNIVKNAPFVVYQNLTPGATPSDTASSVATAII